MRDKKRPIPYSLQQSYTLPRATVSIVAVIVLISVYPLFGQLIPTSIGMISFIAGTILVAAWYFGERRWKYAGAGIPGILWAYIAVLAGSTHLLLVGRFDYLLIVLVGAIFMALALSTSYHWTTYSVRPILFLLLIHAGATIVFYLFPDLYVTYIQPQFTDRSGSYLDYRTALNSNASFNAMYSALGLVMSATCLIRPRGSERANVRLWLYASVFMIALLLTTKRAHPLYATLTLLVVYLLSHSSGKWLKLVGFTGLSCLLLYAGSFFSPGIGRSVDRFLGTFETDDLASATSGRTFLWDEVLSTWSTSPLIGHGWSSFRVTWPDGQTVSTIAHNELLNILFEGGLLGLLLFGTATVVSLLRPLRILRSQIPYIDPDILSTARLSFAIQMFLLLYSFTGGELISKPYTFVPYLYAVAMGFSTYNEFIRRSS